MGYYAVARPKALREPCPKVKTPFRASTLERLKKGLPPYGLRGRWPQGDDGYME